MIASDSAYDFDLLVIGAGSGGVRASRIAAGLGARVAIVEDRALGGTCVNEGCVPKKLFVYGSHYSDELSDAPYFGWQLTDKTPAPLFHWPTLRKNKDHEIERLNGIYAQLLYTAGVEVIHGRATISDPHGVDIGDRKVSSRYILVATGAWPTVPRFPGSEYVINSNDVFHLDQLPERIVIVGGGYIAVEFAGIFRSLGVDTRLLYRGPLVLRGFDNSIREVISREMAKKDIKIHYGVEVERIRKTPDGTFRLELSTQDIIPTECVMYATGRHPKVEQLGLDALGIQKTSTDAISVDSNFRTSVPSIYAIGDVIGGPQLTPIAIREGIYIARHLFDRQPDTSSQPVDYQTIPTAIFCQPTIGTVGLNENEALTRHRHLRIYESDFRPLKLALTPREERAYIKLVVDDESDRVLGAHMVGDGAAEIIQGLAVAITKGATKTDFDATVAIHPTTAEEFVTLRNPRHVRQPA